MMKPKCTCCGALADYFLYGSWVCLKCWPWKGNMTKKQMAIRQKRLGRYVWS